LLVLLCFLVIVCVGGVFVVWGGGGGGGGGIYIYVYDHDFRRVDSKGVCREMKYVPFSFKLQMDHKAYALTDESCPNHEWIMSQLQMNHVQIIDGS